MSRCYWLHGDVAACHCCHLKASHHQIRLRLDFTCHYQVLYSSRREIASQVLRCMRRSILPSRKPRTNNTRSMDKICCGQVQYPCRTSRPSLDRVCRKQIGVWLPAVTRGVTCSCRHAKVMTNSSASPPHFSRLASGNCSKTVNQSLIAPLQEEKATKEGVQCSGSIHISSFPLAQSIIYTGLSAPLLTLDDH